MDYLAVTDEELIFSSGTSNGATVCQSITIVNDNVLEPGGEFFNAIITSLDADISDDTATIMLIENNDAGTLIHKNRNSICYLH